MKQSLTITGVFITLIVFLGQQVGVDVVRTDIQTTIETIAQIVGIGIAWYGRYRHGDISILGQKK